MCAWWAEYATGAACVGAFGDNGTEAARVEGDTVGMTRVVPMVVAGYAEKDTAVGLLGGAERVLEAALIRCKTYSLRGTLLLRI